MEYYSTLFFITFSAAFLGTMPPGMLNLTALKIRVSKGKKNAYLYTLGVCIIILIQALIGVQVSKYLYNHPEVIDLLMKIAIGVFAILSVYFYASAKKVKDERTKIASDKKRNDFLKGLILASLNMLAIPYYSGINAMWRSSGWIEFNPVDTTVFVLGASLGTAAVLLFYVLYFKNVKIEKHRFSKRLNYMLSALMVILVMITVIRLYYR